MEPSLHDLEQRIGLLEQQLALLQQAVAAPAAPPPSTLVAPVTIVDQSGQKLITIEQSRNDLSIKLFNNAGRVAAALGVDGTQAGYLSIRNAEGELVGLLDVEMYGARLMLQDHARRGGLILFGGDSGGDQGGGLHVLHTAGGISISLWSTEDGGKIQVYDGQLDETLLVAIPPERD